MPGRSEWSPHFRHCNKNFVRISYLLMHATHTVPSKPSLFDNPNNIRRRVQVNELLIMPSLFYLRVIKLKPPSLNIRAISFF
jgi:hypothetical protein